MLSVERPCTAANSTVMTSLEEMEKLFARKCSDMRKEVLGIRANMQRCRYVDTTQRACLNIRNAIKLAEERAEQQVKNKRAQIFESDRRVLRQAQKYLK